MERRNVEKWVLPFMFFLLVFPLQLLATNYYVSTSGNDLNSGTSLTSPWKTLAKVQAESSKFAAGDVIAFKGGERFFGSLTLTGLSGTATNPITITSYDTGKAVLTGSKSITGWTKYSGNVWVASVNEEVFQLFRADTVLTNARIPEIKGKYAIENNFLHINTVVNNRRSFICTELIGAPNMVGATVHVSTYTWLFHKAVITAFNSATGQVTIGSDISGVFEPGQKVFINNHLNFLNSEGDWYYDTSSKRLYLFSVTTPNSILGNTLNTNCFTINDGAYVKVENLSIQHYGLDGVYSSKVDNLSLLNNEFYYCYETSIHVQDAVNSVIEGNFIKGSSHAGIKNYNGGSRISSNSIYDAGSPEFLNKFGFQGGIGINTIGKDGVVSNNKIYNSGYNGISYSGYNSVVKNNFIKYFHLSTSDGGGIYSYFGTKATVAENIIIGYPVDETITFKNRRITQGIYLDNNTIDATVIDNTVVNSELGIALNFGTKNNVIKGNTIYTPKIAGIWFTESTAITPGVTNNVSENNQILTNELNVIPFIPQLLSAETYNWYTLRDNQYFNAKGYVVSKEEFNGSPYDLNEWKKKSGQDLNSTANQSLLNDFKVITVYDSLLVENGDFSSDKAKWVSWSSVSTIDNHPGNAEDKFIYDTLALGKTRGSVSTISKPVQMGFDYVLQFDMNVSKSARNQITIAYYNGEVIVNSYSVYCKPGWHTYSIPIYDLGRDDQGLKLQFYVNSGKQYANGFSLDNVKLLKCSLEQSDPTHQLVYNEGFSNKRVDLIGTWRDLQGNLYSGSIELLPSKSKILLFESASVPDVIKDPIDPVVVNPPTTDSTEILGNSEVFGISSSTSFIRALPVISYKDGTISSMSIYHSGGTGKLLLAIYADDNGGPGGIIAKTEPVNVNSAEGWQTVQLNQNLSVVKNQKIWLAWLFENTSVKVRFSPGTPGRAQGLSTWVSGLPEVFSPSNFSDYTYSVYCSYAKVNNELISGTLGHTEVYSISSSTTFIRAMSVTSNVNAYVDSISIYHGGGTGNLILSVYSDVNGTPGVLLGQTNPTVVNTKEGWQKVKLSSTVPVKNGDVVWLSWLFEQDVKVRFTTGVPARAQGVSRWGDGLPVNFGPASFSNYIYSIYCTYKSSIESPAVTQIDTIGNTAVYGLSSSTTYIRALPVVSAYSGFLKSISIYHNGGTGNLVLSVYSDNSGVPDKLLGKTNATSVSINEGWQTINLSESLPVNAGEKVWLGWLFENDVKVRFTTGLPARAQGSFRWTDGISPTFGSASFANYTYSVFCTIEHTSTAGSVSIKSSKMGTMSQESGEGEEVPEVVKMEELLIYPNPNRGSATISWKGEYDSGVIINVYDLYGRIAEMHKVDGIEKQKVLSTDNYPLGTYLIVLRDVKEGKVIGKIQMVKQ